jgi:nucleoside-diphosphate-sugar epimerase
MKGPVLVTGGAGYIGSVLVRRLLDAGQEVRVLDRLLYGARGLSGLEDEARLSVLQHDLRDPRVYDEALAGVTSVIHLAAIVGDKACAADEERAVQTNWVATVAFARRASALGVQRFVFASTCSVYGEGRGEVLTEESPPRPLSLYAETRYHGEQGLLELRASSGEDFGLVLLRFGTVYGLSPRMRFDLVVNFLAQQAVRKGEVSIFGGSQWRPFVHVVLNVGDNLENYQLRDLKEEIEERIPGTRVRILPEAVDPRTYRVSFDRIESFWGFRATRRVGDGLAEVARAVREGRIRNPDDPVYRNA